MFCYYFSRSQAFPQTSDLTMARVPTDPPSTTPAVSSTTEEFDLVKKYLSDWPPAKGVDVHDAATYGLAFLILIGLLFTFCVVLDLDFFRRKLKSIRELKREKELEQLLGIQCQTKAERERAQARRVAEEAERRYSGLRAPTVVPYDMLQSPPPYYKIKPNAI